MGNAAGVEERSEGEGRSLAPTTLDQCFADVGSANAVAENYSMVIGATIKYSVIIDSSLDRKLLEYVWTFAGNVVIGIEMSRFAIGFVEEPFRIPDRLTVKQFYDLYNILRRLHLKSYGELNEEQSGKDGAGVLDDGDHECKVCLDAKTEIILCCNHCFCTKCFSEWQKKNSTCAMCRRNIYPEDPVAPGNPPHVALAPLPDGPVKAIRSYFRELGRMPVVKPPPPEVRRNPGNLSPIRRQQMVNQLRAMERVEMLAAREGVSRGSPDVSAVAPGGVGGRGASISRISQSSRSASRSRGPWTCEACTFAGNAGALSRCSVCHTSRTAGGGGGGGGSTSRQQQLENDLSVLLSTLEDLTMRVPAGRGATLPAPTTISNLGSSTAPPREATVGGGGGGGGGGGEGTEDGERRQTNAQSLDLDYQLALLLALTNEEDL